MTSFYEIDDDQEGELFIEKLPKYRDPGFLEIEILEVRQGSAANHHNRYDVEEIEADLSSSVYWIGEGVGVDFWVNQYLDLDLPGKYRIEGITGTYYRGDWSAGEDDDEDWDFERVLRIE